MRPLRPPDRNFVSMYGPPRASLLTDCWYWGNFRKHVHFPPKRVLAFSQIKCLASGHFYFEPYLSPELWLWVFTLHITSILVWTANVKVMTCDSFSGALLKMLKEKCVTRWPSEVPKRNIQRENPHWQGWPQCIGEAKNVFCDPTMGQWLCRHFI